MKTQKLSRTSRTHRNSRPHRNSRVPQLTAAQRWGIAALGAAALLLLGMHPAQAQTYAYEGQTPGTPGTPTTGSFAGGFYDGTNSYVNPLSSLTTSLVFNGTTGDNYTATDNLGAGVFNFNNLTFGNVGNVTVAQGSGTTLTQGGAATINLNNTGTLTFGLALAEGGFGTTFSGAGSGTFSGVISGAGGLTQSGSGILTLSNINTYTGGTTVNSGTLKLNSGGGAGAVRGVVTVNSGATLSLNVNNALGYSAGSQVTTLNINGGTVSVTGALGDEGYLTSFNLTGGTLAYAGSNVNNGYQIAAGDATAPGITSNASATTSTISGGVNIRSGNLGFNVAGGTTASGIDLLVSGVISGATYGITKTGAGVMALTNANTYTGTTTISAGTLQLGSGGTTGTLAAGSAITDNSTFTINRSNAVTQGTDFSAAAITGTGGLTQAGAGNTTLNVTNTYTGATVINAGTLTLTTFNGGGGALSGTPTITVNSGGSLVLTNADTLGYTSGKEALFINSGGQVLNNATTASRDTLQNTLTMTGGILGGTSAGDGGGAFSFDAQSGNTITATSDAAGNAALINASKIQLQVANELFNVTRGAATPASDLIISSALNGNNGFTKTGAGILTLSGANVYTGATGDSAGTLNLTGSLTGSNISTSSAGIFTESAAGFIGGTGITFAQGSSGSSTLAGANTYTGTTTISAGTLQLGSGGTTGTLAAGSAITDNSTFTINRSNAVTQGTDFSAAAITGSGSLTQAGGSILTLNAANSYTGGTNVNSGTLNLTGSLGAGAVTVASGARLTGAGNGASTGKIGGSLTVNGGGSVNLTAANSGTPLTDAGALTLGTGSASILNYTTGASLEELTAGGALTLNSGGATVNLVGSTLNVGTYNLIGFGSQTGSGVFNFSNGTATENVGRDTYTLLDNVSGNDLLQLGVTGVAAPNVAYFNGGAGDTIWNDLSKTNTNFSTNLAGTTDAGNSPAANTDVILNASSQTGTLSETLGSSTTINSLNVNGNGTTTLAADGSTLTINGLADSNTDTGGGYTGNAAGTGISIANNAHPFTVNVPLVVGGTGANQTWTNGSGSLFTVNGAVTGTALTGNTQTLTLAGSGSGGTTLAGVVSDPTFAGNLALSVNDTGTGITTLSGANTFSGSATLTAGTLDLANQLALQNSTLALNGGSVTFDSAVAGNAFTLGSLSGSANLTLANNAATPAAIALTLGGSNANSAYSGILSGGGSLTKVGTGTLTLSGVNTYTGATSVSAGTLSLTGTLGSGGGTAISSGATLTETGAGVIAGTSTLTVTGGAATLNNTNPYTGATVVSGGTLTLTSNGGTGFGGLSGTPTITVNSGGKFVLTNNDTLGYTAGHEALIINSGGQVLNNSTGAQRDTLQNTVTMTGGILGGTSAGDAGGLFSFNNTNAVTATSDASGAAALINAAKVSLQAGTETFNVMRGSNAASTSDLTISSQIVDYGGGGGLTKTGTGILTLSGANTYANPTLVSAGTLNLTGSGSLIGSNISTSGAGAFSEGTTGVIAGTGTTVTQGSSASTFLNSQNTYTGGTTINSGFLGIGNSTNSGTAENTASLGTGGVTINTGGTLALGDIGSTANAFSIGNAVTLAGGTLEASEGTQTLTGGLNVTGTSVLASTFIDKSFSLSGATTGAGGLTIRQSGLDTPNGNNANFDGSTVHFSNTGTATVNTYSGTVTVTPLGGASGGSYLELDGSSALANATINLTGANTGTNDAHGASPLLFGAGIGTAVIGGLSGAGGFALADQAGPPAAVALTVNDSNASPLTYSGVMSGSGSFTKTGTGTETFTGTNTYSGGTTVSAGMLALTAAQADGAGSLTINSTGVVTVSTTNSSGGAGSALGGGGVILNSGTLKNANLGGSAATGETPQTNDYQNGSLLTLTSGTTSFLDFGAGNTGAAFYFSGLQFTGSTNGTLLDVLNYTGNFNDGTNGGDGMDQLFIGTSKGLSSAQLGDIQFINPNNIGYNISASQLMDGEISPAPEPGEWATLSMLGVGLGGLLLRARKRQAGKVSAS